MLSPEMQEAAIRKLAAANGDVDVVILSDLDVSGRKGRARARADPHDPLLADDQGRPTEGPRVVIVPDRHGTGTNGLLLDPPRAIEPSFGPGSCERHLELTLAAGAESVIAHPSSLLLDIDTGADLAALRERLALAGGGAARTRAVLGMNGEGGR
jgi:hypothetical protein